MDNHPFKTVDSYFLNTGRRYGEIGAISNYYWRGDEVFFKWFPEFLAKMGKDFGEWKSDPPKISPFTQEDNVYVPSETSTTKDFVVQWVSCGTYLS